MVGYLYIHFFITGWTDRVDQDMSHHSACSKSHQWRMVVGMKLRLFPFLNFSSSPFHYIRSLQFPYWQSFLCFSVFFIKYIQVGNCTASEAVEDQQWPSDIREWTRSVRYLYKKMFFVVKLSSYKCRYLNLFCTDLNLNLWICRYSVDHIFIFSIIFSLTSAGSWSGVWWPLASWRERITPGLFFKRFMWIHFQPEFWTPMEKYVKDLYLVNSFGLRTCLV